MGLHSIFLTKHVQNTSVAVQPRPKLNQDVLSQVKYKYSVNFVDELHQDSRYSVAAC